MTVPLLQLLASCDHLTIQTQLPIVLAILEAIDLMQLLLIVFLWMCWSRQGGFNGLGCENLGFQNPDNCHNIQSTQVLAQFAPNSIFFDLSKRYDCV